MVVNGVVGFAGLSVTLAALEAGRRLALANKESIIAGAPVVAAVRDTPGAELLPVDSEHCAVHQCLRSGRPADVARLLLTASGGPFRGRKADELADVGVDEALAHPTWSMGPKITVDSSTLMNKGLEVIEAHELFGVPYDAIDVVVHPQSDRALDGRVRRRSRGRAAVASRHAAADRLRPGLSGPSGGTVRRHRLGRAVGARVRATRPGDVPVPRPRLPGGPGRRPGAGLAERRQRGGRRGVPGRPHHLGGHRRHRRRHPRPLRRRRARGPAGRSRTCSTPTPPPDGWPPRWSRSGARRERHRDPARRPTATSGPTGRRGPGRDREVAPTAGRRTRAVPSSCSWPSPWPPATWTCSSSSPP